MLNNRSILIIFGEHLHLTATNTLLIKKIARSSSSYIVGYFSKKVGVRVRGYKITLFANVFSLGHIISSFISPNRARVGQYMPAKIFIPLPQI
jgi:hypothetical protein